MKQRTLVLVGLIGLFALLCGSMLVKGQAKPGAKYEAAILKWDGDDKVWVCSGTKTELVRVYAQGGTKTKEAPEEEYCVNFMANKMAADGWELVNLNNRRILMQRPAAK